MPGCMENVRYQIKVDGIDKDWRDMGTEHRFNGYLLQPGNYRLHVRAYNGVMNEGNAKERVSGSWILLLRLRSIAPI